MNEIFKEIKVLQLIMGRQCNVRCVMCYQRTYDPAGNMPAVFYKEYFLPLYPYLSRMIIMGGEPTVMPNCRELVKFMDRFTNVSFGFFTNGVRVDEFWMQIFKERSDSIRVSINAATRKTYDRIVKYGDFNKVIENVRRITHGRIDKKPSVAISAVLLNYNVHEIAELIDLGHELGVDKVQFSVDPVLSFRKLPAKEVRRELDKAHRVIERTGMKVQGLGVIARHVNYPLSERSRDVRVEQCRTPFSRLVVDEPGNARVCSHTWRILGNIYKSSLKEILENWQRTRLQQMTASGDHSWCVPYCFNNPAPRKMARFNRYLYFLRRNPGELFRDAMHRLDRIKHL